MFLGCDLIITVYGSVLVISLHFQTVISDEKNYVSILFCFDL
jgi:hypothetical protein